MEIQCQDSKSSSDSSDSWDPQQVEPDSFSKQSLFQKITICYNDEAIEKKLDLLYEKPIINSDIFPFEEEQNEQRINFDETQEEPSQNTTFPENIEQKTSKNKNHEKPMNNEEALFNPIQDDQNQHWLRRKLRKQMIETSKIERPLTCPRCFTQICYNYGICRKEEAEGVQSGKNVKKNTEPSSQKTYKTRIVQNVEIQEHKILRNRFASQKMSNQDTFGPKQRSNQWNNKRLQEYEKELKARYDDINVKVLITCSQCSLQIGYWDANEQVYVLCNVI